MPEKEMLKSCKNITNVCNIYEKNIHSQLCTALHSSLGVPPQPFNQVDIDWIVAKHWFFSSSFVSVCFLATTRSHQGIIKATQSSNLLMHKL